VQRSGGKILCCAAIRAPTAALGLAKLAPSISGAQSGWRAFVARKSGRLLLALQPGEKRHNVVGVAARSAANRRRLRLWYGRQGDSASDPVSSADGDCVARLYPANRAVEQIVFRGGKSPTLQATSRSTLPASRPLAGIQNGRSPPGAEIANRLDALDAERDQTDDRHDQENR
jgi:hypothetical protein